MQRKVNQPKKRKTRKDKNISKPTMRSISIDWEQVDGLLMKFLDVSQVAERLGISYSTLERRIAQEKGMTCEDYKLLKRKKGEAVLKEVKFELAVGKKKKVKKADGTESQEYTEKPNVVMSIFLGKNELGQSDRLEQTVKGKLQVTNFEKNQLIEILKGAIDDDSDKDTAETS